MEFGDRRRLLGSDPLVTNRFVDAGGIPTVGGSITRIIDGMADADRLPFISHVIRYHGRPLGAGNCTLYNVYQTASQELIEFCDGQRRPRIPDWNTYRSAYSDGWTAIDALKVALEQDAASGNYTHLIVAMMGWRTSQEEAIRNFNSLIRSVHLAAGDEFRPLFLGITWMGHWEDRWLDPLMEVVSYSVIADLADLLGLTWVGALTDEVILPLSKNLNTIYVTHSFGSRTASTAVCIGAAIRRTPGANRPPDTGAIDRLIGLQAAFSLERFKWKRPVWFYEDVYFPGGCARANSIVLSSSAHDAAAKTIVWADFPGNYRYYLSYCTTSPEPMVACASVDHNGRLEGSYDLGKKVLLLDATRLISFKAPGTDGGAHSDIFRPAMGRLIWELIEKRAPGPASEVSGDEPR